MSTFPLSTSSRFQYAICNRVGKWSDAGGSPSVGSYVGALRGVLNEPTFVSKINQGFSMVKLELDHWPSEIAFGQLIRITYPDGELHGFYFYEGVTGRQAKQQRYEITLTPLVAQLKDTDFGGIPGNGPAGQLGVSTGATQVPSTNFSTDGTQAGVPNGVFGFAVPVNIALALCANLAAYNITETNVGYAYTYNQCTAWDPLDQAIKFGGPGWYWFCDALGRVILQNTPRYTHVLTSNTIFAQGDWTNDTVSLVNGQPCSGGVQADSGSGTSVSYTNTGTTAGGTTGVGLMVDTTKSVLWHSINWNPASITGTNGPVGTLVVGGIEYQIDHSGTTSSPSNGYIVLAAPFNPIPAAHTAYTVSSGQTIYAFAQDNNPANPYSVPNIGRRTAPVYSDTSVTNQTTLSALALSMLAYGERVSMTRTVQVSHYLSQPVGGLAGTPPRFQPGDAIYYEEAFPDPTLIGPSATVGPYLITDVTEYGGTGKFELTVSADNNVPMMAFNPGLGTRQAISKLQQNG